jgi:hypothetical protein
LERFAQEVECLSQNPHVAVVGTGASVIDESGRKIGTHHAPSGPENVRRRLWRENILTHGSVMMRR